MSERLFVRLHEDPTQGPESRAPADALRLHTVPARHQPLVAHMLSYDEHIRPGEEVIERVLPDGALRLIYLDDGSPQRDGPQLLVAGPTAAASLVRLRGRVHGLSFTLHTGAAAALFDMPARELTDLSVPLEALWRGEGHELPDRMAAQADTEAQVQTLLEALARRARPERLEAARAAGRAVRAIQSAAPGSGLRHTAAALGVGERRLQRIFHEHVGLAPKVVARLARLHQLLRALRHEPVPAWAELAPNLGFYDQAHLANEFRALSGLTPGEFLARSGSDFSKTRP
jgi:AraC-like DNA-binding protein